jgi:hypothetical protein
MNNQLNLYGDENILINNFQHNLLDDISKIKPSLDGMYNIEQTELDRPFLEDISSVPEENLLGQNLNGLNSPIANQISQLENENKINGSLIVENTKINTVENNIDLNEINNKMKELEKINEMNNISSPSITKAHSITTPPIFTTPPSFKIDEPIINELIVNEPIVNKVFQDLYHKSMTNNVLILLFLIIIGITFAVYRKEIKKMLK